jgi:cobalt-factor III methyltransferase
MNIDKRGVLFVVGLGPGSAGLLTPDASAAIEAADTVVGYHGYLDLIADRLIGKVVIGRDLGQEVERAQVAFARAKAGKTVALVSSGDAGIYGMGGVACELAAEHDGATEIVIVPGVTAAISAAALLGAPLANDWASISLSDLLTPWTEIARRIDAAARADFVIVFYNPGSQTRTWQLAEATERLLIHRDPGTPVGLVENAYRTDQRVEIIQLDALSSANVSMFTTVVVGNSQTAVKAGRLVTPRIYAAKVRETSRRPIDGPVSRDPLCRGDLILAESLEIIDRELGRLPADRAERAIVTRMIHASGDFEFATTVRFGIDAIGQTVAALRRGAPIIADVEMLRIGIRRELADPLGVSVLCALGEVETANMAASQGITRSAAGVRRLAAKVGDGAVLAIGNAPTALLEALSLMDTQGWRPACVVGIPVGFVAVEQSKRRLVGQDRVPYVTSLGRKGGTAVTAAAVNALLELAHSGAYDD